MFDLIPHVRIPAALPERISLGLSPTMTTRLGREYAHRFQCVQYGFRMGFFIWQESLRR